MARRAPHGDAEHRQRGATTPRRKSTRPKERQNGPSDASRRSPDATHRASRRSYPRDRFAAIKSLPSGRIVLLCRGEYLDDSRLHHQLVVEARRRPVIHLQAADGEGDALEGRQPGRIDTEVAQHFGARALGEFKVVGVINHAAPVGVLVIDPQGMKVNAVTEAFATASTYFHRKMAHLTALQVLSARSVVRRDGGASQGPRDESVRARKAARRVAFRGLRRALAPLDDVQTSPARRFLPGGREKTIICAILL